ncbi:hypothetical protein AB0M29_43685 [Streptomyces sp. NPDC051976]|uniref:hypothetical protein n=1 Tax=Streptomyces sp. NPDC051976 TaxID=3154947 RepID=UPI003448792A
MHYLRTLKRGSARIAAGTAVILAASFLTTPSAHAAGTNWDGWSGACYGWTTWAANTVTGHTFDHSGDQCEIFIAQRKSTELPEWPDSTYSAYTSGNNTSASTPTWWHGPASNGSVLYDYVCVTDLTARAPSACSPDYT